MTQHDVRLPKVIYPGGLSQREHAIIEARKWQMEHGAENIPHPSREFLIIRDLLVALGTHAVTAAIEKGEQLNKLKRIVAMIFIAITLGTLLTFSACGTLPPSQPPTQPPIGQPPVNPPIITISPIRPLHVEGTRFFDDRGIEWKWRGATDFLLLKLELDGVDINPILDQRHSAGANLVRVFAICKNLADLNPSSYNDYWGGVFRVVEKAAAKDLYVEFTVFADAQLVIPGQNDQLAFWQGFAQLVGKPNVFLELVNENSHSGNTINTSAFPRIAGILSSHGSEQTDQHPIEPYWDYSTYHARRDGPPSAKGATNYDHWEFESTYPKPVPFIPDEGAKVADYHGDVGFAALMGRHANVENGGTCHTQSGVMSQLWTAEEFNACKAFFGEIK